MSSILTEVSNQLLAESGSFLQLDNTPFSPTALFNSSEGGTNTAAVTTANSGGASGNAFQLVTVSPTCTFTFDNTVAAHGLYSYKVALGATAGESYVQWDTALTANPVGTLYARGYYYFTAIPTTTPVLFRWMSGTSLRGSVHVNTAGKLACFDSTGTLVATSTGTVPLNTWFRVEVQIIGSATAGQITVPPVLIVAAVWIVSEIVVESIVS